ncbi:MAG: hypothetical protein LC733_01575 [Actinobacteria bacterium]|nr:hypothetical protein [Actinomycetota bacterium]
MSGRTALGRWLLAVAGAILVLQAAGGGALATPPLARPGAWVHWLVTGDPVVTALALLRLVALTAAWYLLAVSLLGMAVRLLRSARLVTLADQLTVPAVRRLLVAAAGASLATTVSPTFALALGPHPPAAVAGPTHPQAAAAGQPTEDSRPPPTVTMRLLPGGEDPPPPAAPPAAPEPHPEAPGRVSVDPTWGVQPGECFWSIAEDTLVRAWGRLPSEAEVVPYWRALIETNRASLVDPGNSDLIFPGQRFTVPPTPAS